MPPDTDSMPPRRAVDERLAEAEAALRRLREQQEVLANGISHDLRAPLRAIGGYARLLAEGHAGELDEEGRAYLLRIRDAISRMEALIEGLLQLSHVARAELRQERVDVGLLVEWCLAELQDAEPARALQAEVQPELEAFGDERQLRQLFERLLHNAWKFSGDRDSVRIEVSGERSDDRVVISVRDHGRGFDMRYARRMFEPFQRLHPSEQGGGHGLGLAVAQGVAERHGGRLWAESEPGRGSTVHVELPAAPQPRSQA